MQINKVPVIRFNSLMFAEICSEKAVQVFRRSSADFSSEVFKTFLGPSPRQPLQLPRRHISREN